MRPSSRLAVLAVLLPPITAAFAQDSPKIDQAKALETVTEQIDGQRKQLFIPGASLAIIKDGKVILLTGLGYRDLKNKKPVTPDTLFAIGSTTKAFTSMLMAMAVDEGKVKWTDQPQQYLPYFRMKDPFTDANVKISDILSHRTGLPRTDFIMLGTNLTPEDLIWNVTRATPTAKLGEKWQYQNIMFVAAGEIERNVYGKPWSELVKERIFDPLGMSRTNTSVPQTLQDPDHSRGYDGTPAMNELPMRAIDSAAPAGAINSSAKEMAEWIRFLLRDGELNGKKIVSQENFDDIFKPHQTIVGNMSYGFGWMLEDWHGHKVEEHGGNIDGFNAQVAMMPDQHLGMVLLTNVSASPLGGIAMDSVWKNLVGVPPGGDQIVALTNADQEVGTYRLDLANLDMVVTHEGDKLFVHPTGQPKMELLPLGNRRYKVGPPAPDKVYMTFMPDKADPKLTVATLEQGAQTFNLTVPKPFASPISAEELIAKNTAAMGGAENMAKIHSISYHYLFDMETQGIKAWGIDEKVAPNKFAELSVYTTDSGERFAWDSTAFDGTKGYIQASYQPDAPLSGAQLGLIKALAPISQDLDWKTQFSKVEVTGVDKVDGEDVYVLTKTTKDGVKVVDSVSQESFMLLKRVVGGGVDAVTEEYKDYAPIAGVQMPMTIIRETASSGKGTVTISDLKVNEPVDEALLRVKSAD